MHFILRNVLQPDLIWQMLFLAIRFHVTCIVSGVCKWAGHDNIGSTDGIGLGQDYLMFDKDGGTVKVFLVGAFSGAEIKYFTPK